MLKNFGRLWAEELARSTKWTWLGIIPGQVPGIITLSVAVATQNPRVVAGAFVWQFLWDVLGIAGLYLAFIGNRWLERSHPAILARLRVGVTVYALSCVIGPAWHLLLLLLVAVVLLT